MSDLPAGWTEVALGELMPKRRGTIDPRKFPDEEFSLLSIPAFDAGSPERVLGSAVGSPKQLVEPGDVLLAKIVPHIRRAWIVPPESLRLIGSSEWIVFRDPSADPGYLRHLLVSDRFHRAFMQTVAGVGGSLLRARPAHVAEIRVPLPPLEEQRRIAAILDKADELRAKRRAALEQLDSLTQAIFLDMFGDPMANPRQWTSRSLGDLVRNGDRINYGVVQPGSEDAKGVPIVRVGDLLGGSVRMGSLKRISVAVESNYSRSRLRGDELLISCVGSIGTVAFASPDLAGFNIARAVTRVPLSDQVNRIYVGHYLRTARAQRYFADQVRTVAQPTLNIKQIKECPVLVPPLELQDSYAAAAERMAAAARQGQLAVDTFGRLSASLQSRAFRGELEWPRRSTS